MSGRWILRLYPRAWRQRYGDEMRELLSAQKMSLRTLADLIAGAVDARIYPQQTARRVASEEQGAKHMIKAFRCAPAGVSVADQWRSAGWLVGGSIALTVLGIVLKQQIGPNALSEGLVYAAFPASLMLSSECTYLKRYSAPARMVMSVGGALFMIGVMWAAVAIGYRI